MTKHLCLNFVSIQNKTNIWKCRFSVNFIFKTLQEVEFADYYRSKCVGLSPEQAELTYLNKAKTLEMYVVNHT